MYQDEEAAVLIEVRRRLQRHAALGLRSGYLSHFQRQLITGVSVLASLYLVISGKFSITVFYLPDSLYNLFISCRCEECRLRRLEEVLMQREKERGRAKMH